MTIPELLELDLEKLEAMSHEELLAWIQPRLIPVQGTYQAKNVIDTGKIEDKVSKQKDSANDLLAEMKRLMESKGLKI